MAYSMNPPSRSRLRANQPLGPGFISWDSCTACAGISLKPIELRRDWRGMSSDICEMGDEGWGMGLWMTTLPHPPSPIPPPLPDLYACRIRPPHRLPWLHPERL